MKSLMLLLMLLFRCLCLAQNPALSHRMGAACEHAAPPEGMHWVCSNPEICDCRLDRDASDGAKATPTKGQTKVQLECRHAAPEKGTLLICDAGCKCIVQSEVGCKPKSG